MRIIDRYGRPAVRLRISVTNRCNYGCIYCHREGIFNFNNTELTSEDYYTVAKVAMTLGINEFKLTGGEPLVREDIVNIVEKISSLNPKDLSMTTNGYNLSNYAYELKRAGLDRVNVSLPSLNKKTYKFITRIDGLKNVLDGIRSAKEAGLDPVKINIVYLKNLNDNEIPNFISFAKENGLVLQVIELEPLGFGKDIFNQLYGNISDLEKKIKEKGRLVKIRQLHHRNVYSVNGVLVEIVNPNNNPSFCLNCNQIRLTPQGKLKTCLFRNDNLVNIREAIKRKDLEKIKEGFLAAIRLREPYYKPKDLKPLYDDIIIKN